MHTAILESPLSAIQVAAEEFRHDGSVTLSGPKPTPGRWPLWVDSGHRGSEARRPGRSDGHRKALAGVR